MYNAETMQAVRTTAQLLTEENRVLVVNNPASPLGMFVDSYNVDAVGQRSPLTDELMASVEEHFAEINPEPTELRAQDNDLTVRSTAYGIGVIQYNAKNVIVPAIAEMAQNFADRQKQSSAVDLKVDSFNYASVHSAEGLTSHLERYDGITPNHAYRTFLLIQPELPEMIRMVSENNPHLDPEEAQKWALTLSPDEMSSTWRTLFGSSRTLNGQGLDFVNPMDPASTVDRLLFAYCLAGHLIENPMVVQGESVDGEEWEKTVQMLHEFLGSALLATYRQRAEFRQQRLIVLNCDMESPIETRRVRVLLNGDVSEDWLNAGGDVQAILGALSESANNGDLNIIEGNAEFYVNKWRELYPQIQQAALDYADRVTRQHLREAFVEVAIATDTLDKTGITDLSGQVFDMVRSLYPADLRSPYKSFGLMICRMFYPDDIYWDYLTQMEEDQKNFPEATARELSTQALITIVAIWLAKQVSVQTYQPDISTVVHSAVEPDDEIVEPTGAEIAAQVEDAIIDGAANPAEVGDVPMTPEAAAAFHANLQAQMDEAAAADAAAGNAIDPDTGATPVA